MTGRARRFLPGLASVTFRALSPDAILSLCQVTGLAAIEWGGDLHVPHGDEAAARRVARMSGDAGVRIVSYGSYYRLGCPDSVAGGFPPVLASALALGAPAIRVWAGRRMPDGREDPALPVAADDFLRVCEAAAAHGVAISTEWHRGTLNDGPEAHRALFDRLPTGLGRSHWQPDPGLSREANAAILSGIGARLLHLHVFHWAPDGRRLFLREGRPDWARYLAAASGTGTGPGPDPLAADAGLAHANVADPRSAALLEFVPGDDPAVLAGEAETLRAFAEIGDSRPEAPPAP